MIGEYAFSSCEDLVKVSIGANTHTIGNGAFSFCASLEYIGVCAQNAYYKGIGGVLYTKDGTTLMQYPIANTNTGFVIPDSVTTIAADAFGYAYNLTVIRISDNVTTIESGAFSDCYNLVSVIFTNNSNDKGILTARIGDQKGIAQQQYTGSDAKQLKIMFRHET